jgi:SAM-dependent methyltransferase
LRAILDSAARRLRGRRTYSDEEWLERMIAGLENGVPNVPRGPSVDVQARYVGSSGGAAMRECFPFFQLTKKFSGQLSGVRVLDFGVGWGRVIRLFAHDVPESHLFGVDVDPSILEVCRETEVPGQLRLIEPGAQLPFADATFGLAYAYSVFSHLSPLVALRSFGELARVLEPGGQLTFTTQGDRFLRLCCEVRTKATTGQLRDGEALTNSFFEDPFMARRLYDLGELVYSGAGGGGVLTGDFYGWAAIPERWLRSNLTEFEIADITDDRRSASRS